MKLAGRRGRRARLRLEFEPAEVSILDGLFAEIETVLDPQAGPPDSDPVLARLFPAAYRDDEAAAQEYRELTETGLRAERIERFAACRADLHRPDRGIDLADPDVARRWIQAVNDLRLALGTRLGVSEEAADRELDPADPQQRPWLVYDWLGYVQDTVVTELMR